ncbi:MAG: hypothetical protein LUQ69_10320 [Methanoregulaceae archaeon]|nr:hypothetical protein [Methanoregulaceae archaeon]
MDLPNRWKVMMPWVPMTLNVLLRENRWTRSRQQKLWKLRVLTSLGAHEPRIELPVFLQIVVGRRRLQDPDRLMGSLTPIVDALKNTGWLRDDAAKWLTLMATEFMTTGSEKTFTGIEWETVDPSQSPLSSQTIAKSMACVITSSYVQMPNPLPPGFVYTPPKKRPRLRV